MSNSLFTALSGLQANEAWINVIGNNLANANTTGYKSSRAIFSDQFSQTLRSGSLPSGSIGGRNPMQLGAGVRLSDIGRDFQQGALTSTGRSFDLALEGRGHFMLSDGARALYTRVGTFGLDALGKLVDQRTGYSVLGLNGQAITLDTEALFPPSATTQIEFAGNLPAQIGGPLAQVLASTSAFAQGTSAQLTGSIATNAFSVPVGETWTMELAIDGGAPQTVSVAGQAAPYTAQDIADILNALPAGSVTASDVGGAVQLTSNRTGTVSTVKVTAGSSGQDLAGLLGLSLNQANGTQSSATSATLLNDLPTNVVDYQDGDVLTIAGVDVDGSAVSASFVFGAANDGTTLGDLTSFIDNAYGGATASFDAVTGLIELEADTTGATSLSMTIDDQSGVGASTWSQHAFAVSTLGTDADTATTSIEVFDAAGTAHAVTLTFERQDDGSWNVLPTSNDGTITGTLTGLQFAQDGTIAVLPSPASFAIQFAGQNPQTVALDLGTQGAFDGVTQFGQAASVYASNQDGYGAGSLSNIAVDADGAIRGFYTNGENQSLGEIGVATFVNDNGLLEVGSNLFVESPNSGARSVTAGTQGRAGQIVGGALEGSNVSVAEEFVHLIEAQRGFQANARVITATDEVLQTLVNL